MLLDLAAVLLVAQDRVVSAPDKDQGEVAFFQEQATLRKEVDTWLGFFMLQITICCCICGVWLFY